MHFSSVHTHSLSISVYIYKHLLKTSTARRNFKHIVSMLAQWKPEQKPPSVSLPIATRRMKSLTVLHFSCWRERPSLCVMDVVSVRGRLAPCGGLCFASNSSIEFDSDQRGWGEGRVDGQGGAAGEEEEWMKLRAYGSMNHSWTLA